MHFYIVIIIFIYKNGSEFMLRVGQKSNRRNNNELFPKSIRGLIVGKSGCGKTTLLLNLLLKPDWLDYDHLKVFGKSLHQKEYRILKAGFQNGLSKQQIHKYI